MNNKRQFNYRQLRDVVIVYFIFYSFPFVPQKAYKIIFHHAAPNHQCIIQELLRAHIINIHESDNKKLLNKSHQ